MTFFSGGGDHNQPWFVTKGSISIFLCQRLLSEAVRYAGLVGPRGGAGVVARFKQDMYCGGRLVWQEAAVPVVSGCGPAQDDPTLVSMLGNKARVKD